MKQKDLLFILLSSTFVVAAWIAFSVLHAILSSTINTTTALDITPITATFDTKTLTTLKNREVISPQTAVAISPSPTPTPTIAPITPIAPLQTFTKTSASAGGTTQ